MKSDGSIHQICVAAILRHTLKPINFLLTKLYDTDTKSLLQIDIALTDGELPISKTYIDSLTWTLITTRRIISCNKGDVQEAFADRVNSWQWGDTKRNAKGSYTLGEIKIEDNSILQIHIECGKASMVTIYAIMTLARLRKRVHD